jgi:integrase
MFVFPHIFRYAIDIRPWQSVPVQRYSGTKPGQKRDRMAVSNSRISSPTARAKLPISGKPLYIKLSTGVSLGYRRNSGDGVWVVRISDGKGSNRVEKIGLADREGLPSNGNTVLDFPQAQAKALLAKQRSKDQRKAITVAQALDEYETRRTDAGADNKIMSRIRALTAPLANYNLAEVTVGDWKRWHDTIPGKSATVNRLCATIKSAFKQAAERNDITEPWPWMKGLSAKQVRGEEREDRNVVLPEGVVRDLVAEAYKRSYEFGLLVDLSAVTGVRYSQLYRAQVQDLQGSKLTVRPSRKGKPGKSAVPQVLEIGSGLADRIRAVAAGRPVTDPLLTRENGEPWRQNNHSDRFRRIVEAVGQDSSEVSIYALRHTHITRQLVAGHPIRLVATWHDTSSAEIEQRYARNISSYVEPPPAADYGPPVDNANVRPLRA